MIGTLPGSQLSLSGLLRWLSTQGRMKPVVLEALRAQLVQDEARRAGLSVTRAEMQSAADAFRRRHGLSAAADTHTWLSANGMSVEDFQANLEHDLLSGKLRQHLTAAKVEEHFTVHQAGYERLRLAQLSVGRDDLANELASQIREEGRELDAVAAEHRIDLVRGESFRRDLSSPLAAAIAVAEPGQLLGPVVTRQGFVLVLVEQISPSILDPAMRQHIENELFSAWVVERMREAKIDLALSGTK
jgi:hypothetical protein